MTDNKYSGIGRRLLDERAAREASAIDLTGKDSPDAVAEQFRLAEQAGAPVEAVRDDPEGARLKLERERMAALSPATRRWLAANPDNYAIAKDDTSPLNEMAVRFGAGLMRNMPIFGSLAGIEAPRPAMPQMQAPRPALAQEISGMFRAGWYSGQAGGAIGLPDFSSASSRQVTDTVAQGFGLSGAAQADSIATGAYAADRSAASNAAGVTGGETQAQFQKIADADKAGTWSAAAGAWATSPRAIMATLAQSLGATAPGIVLTAAMPASRAVRMASAGGTSFTAEQGFTVLDEMEKAGVDTTDAASVARFVNDPAKMAEARERALSRGLAIGAFDALSAGFAGRLIANARRGMASAAAATAGEAAVQTAAGMAGEATAQIATDGKITSRAEVVGEGLAQSPMFLVEAQGMMRDARRAGEANAERHQAEAEHGAIGDLVRIAGQSKTRERARGKFEGMVRELAADGQDAVHLSPEAVQVLYQSAQEQGIDLAGLVDEGELSASIASGAELAIPIERYAAMVNEAMHNAVATAGGARLTPGMVAGPPDVAREDVRAAIEQALAEIDAEPQARGSGDAGLVYDEVYGQLLSRMDEASAERNASVVQAVYRNLAERMGVSPMDLFQQFRINIPGAVTDRRAAPRGIDLDIDPALDALRAGRLPDDNEVLGPSLTRALRAAGGLADFGGELASMDAGRVLPGLINGAGMTLDDALTWAYQEGYITEAPVQFAEQYSDGAPDINTLLELIGEDLRSGSVRSVSGLNEDRQGFRDRALQLADELDAKGIDLQAMTNEQVREALGYTYLEQAAYHGTPHTVDRFSLQKIGTGEGNQVYGWGLYFASQREVAEHYRTALTGISRMPGAKSAEEMLAKTGGDRAEAIRLLKRKGDEAAVEFLRRNQNRGNLYQVEVPDDDVLLDWDVPMSKQPAVVRQALSIPDADPLEVIETARGYGVRNSVTGVMIIDGHANRGTAERIANISHSDASANIKGSDYYRGLVETHGDPETASRVLMALGIPGLRYLDGVSRGDGEGSRNFVIWDEALISEPVKLNQSAVVDQTETPEFKRWFGDSKVVDAEGKPLVVYHGTNASFDIFEETGKTDHGFLGKGFYFSASATDASEYANNGPVFAGRSPRTGAQVYPVYLSINNPLVLDTYPDVKNKEQAIAFRESAEDAGYDGVIYARNGESGRAEYVAFHPWQVKSATANAGAFDPGSPSILHQGGETPRGSVTLRGQAGARVFDIELTAKMDASTFMHEMGHVYMEMLGDLAQVPDAPQQIRDDLATINRWLGRADGDPLTVDQHEKFARGFEAYLREGKAPSSAMRKAFAAFKVWLTAIYRSARQLNVELSDEVRGVFDRLIATDAEIDDVRDAQGLTPLSADGLAIGMTPAEAAAYAEAQALAQADAEQVIAGEVLRAMHREQQAWYRAEKAKVREQAREELRNDPAYRAMRLMRRGQMPDGSPAPEELVVKLSKDGLLDQFGQSFLRNLTGMYSVEGGVSADQAAALYGFGSGREMIDALVNAPKFEDAVAATTDARMADRHPDPMTDGTLPDRAMAAAHRDRQRDMMLLEVQALERSVNGRSRTTAQVIKGVARAMVGRTKLRNLQPASYRTAEAKAGRDAFKALAAGDNAAVLEARKRQLLNHELYREAVKQRDRAAKIAKYLGKFNKNKERAKLGKVGGPYLDQVDGLLERFDFRAVSNARADKRAALREWVDAQHKAGKTVNIATKLLDDAYRVPYREMTSDDLAALNDAIKQIEALAALKGKLILAGKLRDAAEVDAAMSASVIDGHDARPVTTGERPRMEKVRDAFLQGRVLQGTATDIAHELDGWKDGGAVWENTVGVMRDAVYNNLNPALQKAQDELATIYTKHYTPDELRAFADTFPASEAGGDLWSKRRVLALALNWGNEGNRAAILAQTRPRMTQATVSALLARLDSRDWAFVQDVWNHVNSFWPQIAEVTKRRAGLVPEKVEASGFTITTSDGKVMQVDGGYFPLKYEADSLKAMGEQIDDYYEDLKAGRFASAHVRNGSTIERVGSGGRTVSLELSSIGSHVSDVLRDIHLGDAVNYVGQVLDGPAFKESIERVGLMQYHKALQVWLKDAATGEIAPRTYSEQVARAVRQNFTASVLTWKATTAMLQVSGIIPAGVLLGNGNVLAALRVWMASPKKMTAYAREHSPFLDARLRTHIEAVQTVMDAEAGRIAAGKSAMIRFGYWAIGRIQGIVDTVTWLAAEQVGARKFHGDMDKARAFADDAVTRAQGSGEFIDKSMLQRGTFGDNVRQSEWVKATTALQGYMIAKGNLVYSRTSNTRFKDPAQASRWAMDMLMLFTVEGLVTAMIQGKLPDDEDDDGAADDWAGFLAGDFASAVVGVIPGGGTVVSAAKGFDTGGVVAGAWKAYGDLVEQVADGELDKGVRRAAVNVLGVTLGFPSNQVNKILDAIEADADGKDVSPYEYIAGLTKENKK